MKKFLLFAATLLAGAVISVSCQKDLLTLNRTTWEILNYEDMFAGASMYRMPDVNGTAEWQYDGGKMVLYVNIPMWGSTWYSFEEGDYTIVKYTDNELVVDIFYYEYDDLDPADLELVDTFRGKKIYEELWNGDYYYYYFLPNGHAVDLGNSTDDNDNHYWFDKTRLHCRRVYVD